jgi:hypothetical protein
MISPETLAFHTANARRLRAEAAAALFVGLMQRLRAAFVRYPEAVLR